MNKTVKKSRINPSTILIISGIILLIMMVVAELYFHFISDFRLDTTDTDVFWRAESAQLVNTFGFMIIGTALIVIGIRMSMQKRRRR